MTFEEKKEYVKTNKKLDIVKFDSVKEVVNMIDLLNKEIDDKKEKNSQEDIHSISQFLIKSANRKMFYLGEK